MEPVTLATAALSLVLVLLALRVPIAFALGGVACLGLFVFFAWRPGGEFEAMRAIRPTMSLIGNTSFEFVHNYPLSMIPLFIGLGHIAYHAGITTDLYDAMRVWLARLPGGLAMASVVGCGGFSAITGSSVACASAMGRITVPEMLRAGYSKELSTGAVAAGGTLGSLIPPSLLFVIYSIFTEESVRTLFLAGIGPGLLSLLGFLITIFIWAKLNPAAAPVPTEQELPFTEKLRALAGIWPAGLLLCVIIIGIYWGFFTPTEAAAISMTLALLIGAARRRLNRHNLFAAFRETAIQTSTIFLIAMGAKIFVSFVSLTRIAPNLLDWIQGTGAPIFVVMACVVLFYLFLGMFLDSIGILVLTLPFTIPLVEGYGLDLIWFGVVVVKLLEIGLITPPVGLNVFVIKSVAPKTVELEQIFKGVAWFLILDLVVLLAILLIPEISLFIPDTAR
ncbi:MAG: TRAP transporter large permease [Paracoccaceae bacterium]